MSKTIDMSRSVYELVSEYPELQDIMVELGFTEIKKPAMLHSVGKLMTIPRGAKMKNIPMDKVIMALMEMALPCRARCQRRQRVKRRKCRLPLRRRRLPLLARNSSRRIYAVWARVNPWRVSGRILRRSFGT